MALVAKSSPDVQIEEREFASFLYALDMLELEEYEEFYFMMSHLDKITTSEIRNRMLILSTYQNDLHKKSLSADQRLRIDLWKNRYKGKFANHQSLGLQNQNMLTEYSLLQQPLLIDSKNPILAASLSTMIPGTGQLYSRAYGSAALALVVNSLFGWATYEFFNKNLYGAGGASAAVFSITYVGNIINATKTAQQINESEHREPEEKMKAYLLPELTVP